jgi:hypothetical protein
MTPEENQRIKKLESTITVLINLTNMAFQQLSTANDSSLVMFGILKASQNVNSQLFQTVVKEELRQLLSKHQSQLSFTTDQCNAAIRNAAVGYNKTVAVLNRALEAAASELLPGIKPLPVINLPSEFSGQCDSGALPES